MTSCLCMVESLCCSPKTITTLLIGYTPIRNEKFKKKKKKKVGATFAHRGSSHSCELSSNRKTLEGNKSAIVNVCKVS